MRRTELGVDAPLDGRALVVLEVDGPRQADEFRIEGLRAFLVANVVFDHPQPLVDLKQARHVGLDVDFCIGARRPRSPRARLSSRRTLDELWQDRSCAAI